MEQCQLDDTKRARKKKLQTLQNNNCGNHITIELE